VCCYVGFILDLQQLPDLRFVLLDGVSLKTRPE